MTSIVFLLVSSLVTYVHGATARRIASTSTAIHITRPLESHPGSDIVLLPGVSCTEEFNIVQKKVSLEIHVSLHGFPNLELSFICCDVSTANDKYEN
ncbi:hypothetical protein C0J52_03584 [Blattella germanica]|nr:hypothetical protein C0J52_03584 [Blattella germanica]